MTRMTRNPVKWVVLAILLVLAFGLPQSPASAQDASGVWRGRWTADATPRRREHGGPLRVRLIPTGSNSYQGRFSGRFALVVPYFYRADVVQFGDQLVSTRRLGPFGDYTMRLNMSGNAVSGRWQANSSSGSIGLRRLRR